MKYKCIIFDLDGTIYLGNKLVPRAGDVIKKARQISNYVFFITNNSAKTRREIWNKLLNMGLDIKLDEIMSSSYAIAKYLSEKGIANVYCIGTPSLKEELSSFGINSDAQIPQAIVIGYNKEFKLDDINEMLNITIPHNCLLIAANKERVYPGENGMLLPGAGFVTSAIEYTLNKTIDIIIGKPNPIMLEIMVSNLNINPNEICVIGDSYESDIMMAQQYNAESILISKDKSKSCRVIEKLEELLDIFK